MHRNPYLDDVFDAVVEIVERLDPTPDTLVPSVQLAVRADFTARYAKVSD